MNTSIRRYIIGFILSLVFTLIPYFYVTEKITTGTWLYVVLAFSAVAQILIQLGFFLHIFDEKKPRLKSQAFIFMVTVVVIVVFGTVWIMNSLHYMMMPSEEVKTYIQEEEAIPLHDR